MVTNEKVCVQNNYLVRKGYGKMCDLSFYRTAYWMYDDKLYILHFKFDI